MIKGGKVVESQQFQRQRNKPRVTRLSSKQPSRRWFFRFSLSLLLVLSAVLLWQKLADPLCFPVKKIKITGNFTYVKRNNLQQLILPFLDKGFLRLDSRSLKDRLSQVPWIDSVVIQRFWPDTLAVKFTTKKPVAFIDHSGLLDEQGNVFNPGQVDLASLDLPTFIGPLGEQRYLFQTYQTLLPLISSLALKIKLLKLTHQQCWHVRLSNGLLLYLSRNEPYLQLQRFISVYSDVIASKASVIDYVDLRYAHGMAVKFKKRNTL